MTYQLLADRDEIRFTAEELELYSAYFEEHGLPTSKFYKLVSLGQWKTAAEGETLVKQGQKLERVLLMTTGGARAEIRKPDGSLQFRLWHGFGQVTRVTG
jgi:hypothetical protein